MKTNFLLIILLISFPALSNAQPYQARAMSSAPNGRSGNNINAGMASTAGVNNTGGASKQYSVQGNTNMIAAGSSNKFAGSGSHVRSSLPVSPIQSGKKPTGDEIRTASLIKVSAEKNQAAQTPEQGAGLMVFNNKQSYTRGTSAIVMVPGLYYDRNMKICRRGGIHGLFGVQIGMYKDLSRCRKDLLKYEKKYKIIACILQDVKDDPYCFRLIIGRYMHLKTARILLLRLWREFPGCFVVRYNH